MEILSVNFIYLLDLNATLGLRTGIEFADSVALLERRTGRLAYSCIFRSCSGVVRSNKCIKFTLRNLTLRNLSLFTSREYGTSHCVQ